MCWGGGGGRERALEFPHPSEIENDDVIIALNSYNRVYNTIVKYSI